MTTKRYRVPEPRKGTGGDTFRGRRPSDRPLRSAKKPGRGARRGARDPKHAGARNKWAESRRPRVGDPRTRHARVRSKAMEVGKEPAHTGQARVMHGPKQRRRLGTK